MNFYRFWKIIQEAVDTYTMTPQESMRLLGLVPGYTMEQLEKAYRLAAMNNHPDRGGNAVAFKKVQAAYNQLKTKQGSRTAGTNQSGAAPQRGHYAEPRNKSRQANSDERAPPIPPIPPNANRHQCESWHLDTINYTIGALSSRGVPWTIREVSRQIKMRLEEELARTSAMSNPDRNAAERKKWIEETLKRYKRDI